MGIKLAFFASSYVIQVQCICMMGWITQTFDKKWYLKLEQVLKDGRRFTGHRLNTKKPDQALQFDDCAMRIKSLQCFKEKYWAKKAADLLSAEATGLR